MNEKAPDVMPDATPEDSPEHSPEDGPILAIDPADDSLADVLPLLLAREFEPAISRLKAMVRVRGGSRDVFHQLALALIETGRLAEAVESLATALKIDETHAPAWLALGVTQARLQRPEAAKAALLRATQLDPQGSQGWLGLASVQLLLAEHEAAMASALRTVSLDAASERALWTLAEALRLRSGELPPGAPRDAMQLAATNAAREFLRRHPRSPLADAVAATLGSEAPG